MGHVRRCHSATQIHHFIVVKGGAFCDYGALRQALRETHTRVGVVRELMLQIAEAELDVEGFESPSDETVSNQWIDCIVDPRRAAISSTRARTKLAALKDDLTERAYELSHFYAISCALKDKIEGEHGTLTPDLHAKLDAEMWEHRLRLDAGRELKLGGVRSSTSESISSLGRDARRRIQSELAYHPGSLAVWAGAQDYELPVIEHVLSGEEVCRYVSDADSSRRGIRGPDHAQAS